MTKKIKDAAMNQTPNGTEDGELKGTMPGEGNLDVKMAGSDLKTRMTVEVAPRKRPGERISAGEQTSIFVLEDRDAPAVVLAAELLTRRGSTAHFIFNFDNSLGANGPTLADALKWKF